MLITNFASGELSPTLNGRVDLQQYYQGTGYLKNFDIIPTGGISRRVGTHRLTEAINHQSRLIPFIVNKDLSFVLELYANKIRINYMQNGTFHYLENEITTTYTSSEINEIQYSQNYDTLVLCHKNHKPAMLKFNGTVELGFSHNEISFDYSPDCNIDDAYNYVMVPTGEYAALPTLVSSNPYKFKYYEGETEVTKDYRNGETPYALYLGHLYEYKTGWQLSGVDPVDENIFESEGNYPGSVAFFNNRLFFASTKNSPQKVWASCTPDTNENRYNVFSTYQKYVTVNKVVKEADLHIFTCDIDIVAEEGQAEKPKNVLKNVSQNFVTAILSGDHVITDYYVTGTYIAPGTKVTSVTSTTITLSQNVTTEGNQENQVCSIQLWMNADTVSADDYEYQIVNNNITTADCSFNFELASDENDAINFLSSGRYLAVGTESSIWSIDGSCTATNLSVTMQGRYGSDRIQGMAVASAQIYFAQGKKGIREFYYDNASEAFQTNNIAILAEQMLEESEVCDFDYITNPYNRLLCLRGDGAISSLLYDKNNGVMGWSRIVRGTGKIKSVAVTRGDQQYDLPYFLVEDNGKYYIEVLDNSDKVYLDSWSIYGGLRTGYTDDAWLYNSTTDKECKITDIPADFITEGVDRVYIGYKYESRIKSLPVLTNDPTGKKRITCLLVRFLNSYLPVMKYDDREETFSGVEEPYSGILKMTYPGVYDRDVTFEITTDQPRAVVILSVNAQLAS